MIASEVAERILKCNRGIMWYYSGFYFQHIFFRMSKQVRLYKRCSKTQTCIWDLYNVMPLVSMWRSGVSSVFSGPDDYRGLGSLCGLTGSPECDTL